MRRTGLLLVNLGTPDSPRVPDVRRYLRQFLSDPRVIDLPAAGRFAIANIYVPLIRARASAEAYEQIWTENGSPLLYHGRELVRQLRDDLGDSVQVELGMRYGSPSVESALAAFVQQSVDEIVVLPLFPQYSSAAWGSAAQEVHDVASRGWNVPALRFVPPFYEHPAFLDALAEVSRPVLEEFAADRVLMSFHGVPERHCTKSDDTGSHCLVNTSCCDRIVDANRMCYRAHCYATARGLAERLGLVEGESYEVAFQSRLGRTPWIRPYTDERIDALPGEGVKRVAVLEPSFVADCLETVEEIGIRGRDAFAAAGGEELLLVPTLNSHPAWARAVGRMMRAALGRPD